MRLHETLKDENYICDLSHKKAESHLLTISADKAVSFKKKCPMHHEFEIKKRDFYRGFVLAESASTSLFTSSAPLKSETAGDIHMYKSSFFCL